jgi:parvulin-like peptidyl-prolyl isomerase
VDTDQQVENEDGTSSYAPLSEEEIAEKRALAEDILAQLQSSDDPATLFDQLMEEYNEDPVYSYYPDGYDLYQGDPVMPQLEEAALALKEGEISPMIESDYGFYIVLRLPADLDSFRSELVAQYMEDRFDQEIAQLEVKTNPVWEELDAAAFRTQVMALQAAVQEEVQNAE